MTKTMQISLIKFFGLKLILCWSLMQFITVYSDDEDVGSGNNGIWMKEKWEKGEVQEINFPRSLSKILS